MGDWLEIGRKVVMQPHGAGEIVGLETRVVEGGTRRDYVTVAFRSGVIVMIPVEMAADHLRPAIDPAIARRLLEALESPKQSALSEWAEEEARQAGATRRASPARAACLLHRLYRGEHPDPGLMPTLESLVVGEIALVLGEPEAELVGALRRAHGIDGGAAAPH